MEKYFNTAGSCLPEEHYMVPAAERLPNARRMIRRRQYFVLHAPRQTGKTTSLGALARALTAEGKFLALHFTCEDAGVFGDDFAGVEQNLLGKIHAAATDAEVSPELMPPTPWPDAPSGSALVVGLTAWVARCPRPLVLFFDEIDSLSDQALISVLRQLRGGHTVNRAGFVHSVVLCGMRDVRDYKAASGGDPTRLGTSSPFNIKVESIRLGDFTREEVAGLYAQHTAETGQQFSARAVDLAFYYSQGQPWLVNSLAAEVIDKMGVESTITEEHIDQAKERLIVARATHLDSLAARLHEPRVHRVIEPLIAGATPDVDPVFDDAVSYVADLGLVARGNPVRIANPIYNEVIVRVLGAGVERVITSGPAEFRFPDGRIDFPKLLTAFASFWKENGDILDGDKQYHEVAPQLVFMAFLHRIVNGCGYIDREYGVGRGRIDLLVRQPYTGADGKRAVQREALELKVWADKQKDPLDQGLVQLDGYLDKMELPTGVLVIFDRRKKAAPLADRTEFSEVTSPAGRTITLLRA